MKPDRICRTRDSSELLRIVQLIFFKATSFVPSSASTIEDLWVLGLRYRNAIQGPCHGGLNGFESATFEVPLEKEQKITQDGRRRIIRTTLGTFCLFFFFFLLVKKSCAQSSLA